MSGLRDSGRTGSDGWRGLGKACEALLIGIAFSSCTSDRSPARLGVTTADSAGVEIVSSQSAHWSDSDGWRVSAEPTLEIGTASGDAEYTLYRVGWVTRLPDGRIVVPNGGTAQLRFYDESGAHLFDVGRAGDGPGEFRSLRRIWQIWGDSIMTYDGRLSRVTVFDFAGKVGRTLVLAPHGRARQAFGMRPFVDRSLLVEGVVQGERPQQRLFDGGSRLFERYSSDGEALNPIAEEPIGPRWGFTVEGRVAYTSAPFGLAFVPSASDGDFLYVGPGSGFQIKKIAPDGTVTRIIRWAGEHREVTSEIAGRFRDWRRAISNTPEFLRFTESMLDGLVFPDRMPTYQSLLVDSEGCLWVEQYRPQWEQERRWWVFDPSGRWLGEPAVPTDVDIREIGADYVLGVRRDDETDVERVVMYSLDRGR